MQERVVFTEPMAPKLEAMEQARALLADHFPDIPMKIVCDVEAKYVDEEGREFVLDYPKIAVFTDEPGTWLFKSDEQANVGFIYTDPITGVHDSIIVETTNPRKP